MLQWRGKSTNVKQGGTWFYSLKNTSVKQGGKSFFLKTWMQSRRNIIMFFEKHKCKARRNTILFSEKHKCKMKKQITSMKICLFTHWRWKAFQVSECKNLYNNLKKNEDVMQWHEVASTSIQKNVKKMSSNVMK